MDYKFGFEKLDVWLKSKGLAKSIYNITEKFPANEKFGLVSQITRAAVSVPSNIAEGTGRKSMKDRAHFYQIAYGSLMETLSHLHIAKDLGYINDEQFKGFKKDIKVVSSRLNALYLATKKRIEK
ncbi:MAG: four helix bundle protein [bacterium]